MQIAVDTLNTSGSGSQPEYVAGRTARIVLQKTDGSEQFIANLDSGNAAGTYPTAQALTCGANYKAYVIGNGTQAGAEIQFVSGAQGSQQDRFTIKTNRLDTMEMRAYDTLARGFVYNGSTATGNTAATTWVDCTSNVLSCQFYSTTDNATELAIGSGGSAEVEYYFRTNGAVSEVNWADSESFYCVDTSTSDQFQKAAPVSLDGAVVADSSPSAIGLPASESIEYCWKVSEASGKAWQPTQTGRGLKQLWLAKSGVDASDNPIVRLYTSRKYVGTVDSAVKGPSVVDDAASPNILRDSHSFTQRIS